MTTDIYADATDAELEAIAEWMAEDAAMDEARGI